MSRYPRGVDQLYPRRTRRYESRPGRGVVVAATLDELNGPNRGEVELPHHLLWNPDRTANLDDPWDLEWVYALVLREARGVDDLRAWIDGTTLQGLWPTLNLPRGVRKAWEDQHATLVRRPAAA
jgi:hypothetical protein